MQVNLLPFAILLLSSFDNSIKSNGYSVKGFRGGSFVPEEVDVRFLTRVRRKRSLESHDYHIIEVVRENSKLEIHLTRSDDLLADNFVFVVKNGSSADERENVLEESNDAENCVYFGGVNGMTTDSIPISGEAVLSACSHHEGLTGVITTTEGQYLIQPTAAKSRTYQSFSVPGGGDGQPSLTIRHTVSVITEDDGKTNVRKCEGSIYAPDDPPVEQESPKVEPEPPKVEEKSPKAEEKYPKVEDKSPEVQHKSPKVGQGPPKAEKEPSKAEQEPPKVDKEPPKPEQEPPKPEQEPPKPEQEPPKPEQEPPKLEKEPPKAEQEPPKAEKEPPKAEKEPPKAEKEPPKAEKEPPKAEKEPPKAEKEPPKAEKEPPKAEKEPPKVEQEPPNDPSGLGLETPLLNSEFPWLPNPIDSSPEGLELLKSKQNKVTSSQEPTVELAVFVDEKSLAELEKKLSTKSSKTLKNYIIAMVQQMALVYQRPSISPNVEFKLVRIEILARNPSELNTHHGSLVPFLESFCAYASKQNRNGDWPFDHGMLFTGVDLRQGTSPAAVGVAFTRGMCKRQYACSIVEAGSFAASNVMAHEMGHSLGMEHDGESPNFKCDNSAYVMAAIVGPDQVTWSSCSNENLHSMIQTLHKTKSSFHERGYCLGDVEKGKKSYKLPSKLPGEVYSADTQCKLFHPQYPKAVTKSMESRFVNFEVDMCKRLYCTDTSMLISYFAHPALEGTECMPGKWCRRGECVKK